MNRAAIALLMFFAAPAAEVRYFHFERAIETPPQTSDQVCVALDSGIFAHAAPQLSDLRLYGGTAETPYVLRSAELPPAATQQLIPLNLGRKSGKTVFDVAMSTGSYKDVEVDVDAHDFLATVAVAGSQTESASAETQIGTYTIFDFNRQKLGRSTVLHLPQSDFPYLHLSIAGPLLPESISGLSVERVPNGQPKYVTVAESSQMERQGHASVIDLHVPPHTPVDRVVFLPRNQTASFSRHVEIRVAEDGPASTDGAALAAPTTFSGDLLRLHRTEDGHRIDEERLDVQIPSTLFDKPSQWTVKIQNGDDAPISLDSVQLEMVERDVCFASAGGAYTLYYGDPVLSAPQYDYAALFVLQPSAVHAKLGPERPNPEYAARPDRRPFTERHPFLLWAALGAVLLLLGAVALRSAKLISPTPPEHR